jgi:uncharacterized FAD-dependent dehydrogenase
VDVDPDALAATTTSASEGAATAASLLPPDRAYLTPPVLSSLLSRLRIIGSSSSSPSSSRLLLPPQLADARVVRRSVDARRRRGADIAYSYVVDVTLAAGADAAKDLNLSHRPGRTERLSGRGGRGAVNGAVVAAAPLSNDDDDGATTAAGDDMRPRVIIVGAGPAGLFCALSLARSGLFVPIVLERGMPVEVRGRSIGALVHRREIDPESNFSFGEGGAGELS